MTKKAWSDEWDEIFASRAWGRYPPEELVVFVSRSFGSVLDRGSVRILELGCGPGANVWYVAREGFRAYGVDGSPVAIDQARRRLESEGLSADLRVCDMVDLPFPNDYFDAVIDVGSIQHNRWDDQVRIVREAKRVLVPAGRFFGIMLATGSWGEGAGALLEPNTYRDMTDGPARGCGTTHFFTEEEVPRLLHEFRTLAWERREKTLFERRERLVHWLVTANK